jgi:hypothetical protein
MTWKRVITLYRPTYVTGVVRTLSTLRSFNGQCLVTYRCGDLRARIWRIRVPIVWALGKVLT